MGNDLISSQGTKLSYGRKMKSTDYRPVPYRWMQVLDLHLAGVKVKGIQESTGYSPAMIYRILDDPRTLQLRQQRMEYYDKEFQALQPKVNEAVRKGLDSQDKYLEAAAIWLKHSGKGIGEQTVVNVSAENVAMQILQEAKESRSDDTKS